MTWTEERRRQQAEVIRRWRPWQRSTGPRTGEGKAKSSHNAYKASTKQQLREIASYIARIERERREISEVQHEFPSLDHPSQ